MNKRLGVVLILAFLSIIFFSFNTEAATAVTISVEAGPAFTEEELTEVNLLVPERPAESMPLNVGDKIFFEGFEPLLMGEGTIDNIYETEDETIPQAMILDHVHYQ